MVEERLIRVAPLIFGPEVTKLGTDPAHASFDLVSTGGAIHRERDFLGGGSSTLSLVTVARSCRVDALIHDACVLSLEPREFLLKLSARLGQRLLQFCDFLPEALLSIA